MLASMLVVGAATAPPASAEVYTVCSAAQLVAAIHSANLSPEPSTIDLSGCTVVLTVVDNLFGENGPNGLPAITSQITIENGEIQRAGAAEFRLLYVDSSADSSLTLRNVTLSNGVARGADGLTAPATEGRGGAIFNRGSVVLDQATIRDSSAVGGMGGIFFDLVDAADGEGGAIFNDDGLLSIIDSTLTGNDASGGGGGVVGLIDNRAGSGLGGAIFNDQGTVSVGGSTLVDNIARGGTGGGQGGSVAGEGLGGAIFANGGGGVDVVDSILRGNTAAGGAGGSNGLNVGAEGWGGAIVNGAGDLELLSSTLSDNEAVGGFDGAGLGLQRDGLGGAVFNDGTLTTISTTIDSNVASSGGALYNDGEGEAILLNSTLSLNLARGAGLVAPTLGLGGAVSNDGTVSTDSTTVADNTAGIGGALYNGPAGQVVLANSIFADSIVAPTDLFAMGVIDASSFNLVESSQGAVAGAPISDDPGLYPLASNGGPTRTHAIDTTSPAFDAGGTGLAIDQRGVTRPQGLESDIGAFELDVLGDGDVDGDGVVDDDDNCLGIPNPLQADADADGIGDICDVDPTGPNDPVDSDGDLVPDPADNCPTDANTDQANVDGDAVGDVCDPSPSDPGNGGDTDADGDPDADDNCVLVPNPSQVDTDSDSIGDVCDIDPLDPTNDLDDDDDGALDAVDNCPEVANADQANSDDDLEGDACDSDDDNDGLPDAIDPRPTVPDVADVSVTVSDAPDPVASGGQVTYTITVTNAGPDTAVGATVTDTLPVGASLVSATPSQGSCTGTTVVSCSLGNMVLGSATVTVTVTAPIVSSATTMSNGVVAASATQDPDSGDHSDTETTTVNPLPASTPTVVVRSSKNPSQVGQAVTYTATLTPVAGQPATGKIVFYDAATPISVCGGAAGKTISGTTATCTVTYTSAGSHPITAKYLGSSTAPASPLSPVLTQVVGKISTKLAASTVRVRTVSGKLVVTFSATLTSKNTGQGLSGKTVFFLTSISSSTCSGTTNSSGVATCTVPVTLASWQTSNPSYAAIHAGSPTTDPALAIGGITP